MNNLSYNSNNYKYIGFQKALQDYIVESFSELTRAPVVPVGTDLPKSVSTHVSKVKVEDSLGELSIVLSIYFVQNPNIVISGSSEQPSTADVCDEVGNWVAGRSRSDLQAIGIKSKQTNFKTTLVTSEGEDVTGPTAYSSDIVVEGAGVTLHCRVTVATNNTDRLENWPRQDLSAAAEMDFL